MKLKLSFEEIERLKRIDFLGKGIFIDVEMSKPMIKYFMENIEIDHKFRSSLLCWKPHKSTEIKNDTLYKKLGKANN